MIFGDQFIHYFTANKLGKWTLDVNTGNESYVFTLEEFKLIWQAGIVFNGLSGGLILGNLHYQGGIHLIIPDFNSEIITYAGEMEGWEYLSYPISSIDIGNEFERINNMEKGGSSLETTEFEIPANCKVVDTLNKPLALLIISGAQQFIVNRFATKRYINQLIELDLKNAL
jgi:hypothetical protein